MDTATGRVRVVRFGVFELDRDAGELRRDGMRVRLQDQPLRLLEVLLDQPGKLISREELQKRLWPADTFVEFDHALNAAVNKLRDALGDSAEGSRYLVTVPRRGYRFVAPVEELGSIRRQPLDPISTDEDTGRLGQTWRKVYAALGILALLVAVFYAGRSSRESSDSIKIPHRKFSLLNDFDGAAPLISPDGERIAFIPASLSEATERPIRMQDLDKTEPRLLPGSEGAYYGFWSPDSKAIGFFADDELRIVDSDGGAPRVLCRLAGVAYGGAWSPDGRTIVFSSEGIRPTLFETPARGGVPRALALKGVGAEDLELTFPMFVARDSGPPLMLVEIGTRTSNEIGFVDPDTEQVHPLEPGSAPIGFSNGDILYQEKGPLGPVFALPFSAVERRATGDPFVVTGDVSSASVSRDGTLVSRPAKDLRWQLTWFSRDGERIGPVGDSYNQTALYPALSPDERHVLFELGDPPRDLWLLDIQRSATSQFTTDPSHDTVGIWSRSGRKAYFLSMRDGKRDIYTKQMGPGQKAVKRVGTPHYHHVGDESPDGKVFLYTTNDPGTNGDLWYSTPNKDGPGYTDKPFLHSTSDEIFGVFSPDGKWVAYLSDPSGRYEVYVSNFPANSIVRQISRNGGTQVRWSRNGSEIFYVEGRTLMRATVSVEPGLSVGAPEALFSRPSLFSRWGWPTYDVTGDGQKFLLVETTNASAAKTQIVQNWFAEFRDRR